MSARLSEVYNFLGFMIKGYGQKIGLPRVSSATCDRFEVRDIVPKGALIRKRKDDISAPSLKSFEQRLATF